MGLTIINGVCTLVGIVVGYILCEIHRKRKRKRREHKRREWLQATRKERAAEMFQEIGGDV